MNSFEEDASNEGPVPDTQSASYIYGSLSSRSRSKSFYNWAEANPDQEYRLWILAQPDSVDLMRAASKRLDTAEQLPMVTAAEVAFGILFSSVFACSTVAELAKRQITLATALTVGATACVLATKRLVSKKIPEDVKKLDREKALYNEFFGDWPT